MFLLLAATVPAASGQQLSGRYVAQGEQGVVTLELQQQGAIVTGVLASASASFRLEARQDAGGVSGRLDGDGVELYIELELRGSQLLLWVAEFDPASGAVNQASARQLLFERVVAPPAANAGPAPSSGDAADPFSGRFAGDGVELELSVGGSGYVGSLRYQGQRYPVQARAVSGHLEGTFRVGGQAFAFVLQRQQEGLLLESGGASYRLLPQGAATAEPGSSGGEGGSAGATPPGASRYAHPLGFQLLLPAGWSVQEASDAVLLLPADADQASETYFLVAEPVAPGTRPDDPLVGQYLDGVMAQLPGFRRSGPVTALAGSAGPVAVFAWEGSDAQGRPLLARAYVAVINGYGVALAAVATRERLAAREAALQQLAASFEAGQVQLDPALVGLWSRFTSSSTLAGSGSTYRVFEFRPDGTFAYQSEFSASGTQTDDTGSVVGGWRKTLPDENGGRWVAAAGRLTLFWNDGSEDALSYQLRGAAGSRELWLAPAGGEGTVWVEGLLE